jgi:hypothetical protein
VINEVFLPERNRAGNSGQDAYKTNALLLELHSPPRQQAQNKHAVLARLSKKLKPVQSSIPLSNTDQHHHPAQYVPRSDQKK